MQEASVDPSKSLALFEEHLCFNKQMAENTIRSYMSRLSGFLDYLRASRERGGDVWRDVDRHVAESYLEFLASKGRVQSTINLTAASLRVFFDFLVLREEADANPFAAPFYGVPCAKTPPTESHTLTDDDIRILLFALRGRSLWEAEGDAPQFFRQAAKFGDYKQIRDEAMVKLVFFGGLKTGEVTSVAEDHFDRQNSMLLVSTASQSRWVYLVPSASSALGRSLEAKATLFPESEFAFVNRFGKRLSERSFRRHLSRYASDCQLDADVCPGALRRAFERRLIMEETEEWLIQYLLGAEDYTLTKELVSEMMSALTRVAERIGA